VVIDSDSTDATAERPPASTVPASTVPASTVLAAGLVGWPPTLNAAP
jgi:hypothetical protein